MSDNNDRIPSWIYTKHIDHLESSDVLIECNRVFWLLTMFETMCVVIYSIFLIFGLRHVVSW